MTANTTETSLSTQAVLAYSSPMVALAIINMLLIVYVPPFYAAEIGIDIATVGFIFFLARGFDAIIDPVVGNLSDISRSPWGRRKPWFALGAPLLIAGVYAFMQPPADVDVNYLAVTAFLFYVALAIVIIPYFSWGAELARDYAGRTRVNSYREAAGMAGTVIATALPLLILPAILAGEPQLHDILRILAWTVIVLLAIGAPIALLGAPREQATAAHSFGLLRALGLLRRNKPLLRVLAGVLLLWLGGAVYNAMILFVIGGVLKLPNSAFLWFVFVQYILALAGIPFWAWFAEKFGRHRALVIGSMVFFLCQPLFYLAPEGSFETVMAIYAIIGFATSVIWVMPPALVADTVDYGVLKGGSDDTALYMALYMFVQKIALAFGVGLALPLAGALGFNPTQAPTQEALNGLRFVGLVLPSLIGVFGALILFNHPITARAHAAIRRRLERRAAAQGASR